jgi:hypothetical protein
MVALPAKLEAGEGGLNECQKDGVDRPEWRYVYGCGGITQVILFWHEGSSINPRPNF